MFTVAAGAADYRRCWWRWRCEVGSCWIGSMIFAADLVRSVLDLPDDLRNRWAPLPLVMPWMVQPARRIR